MNNPITVIFKMEIMESPKSKYNKDLKNLNKMKNTEVASELVKTTLLRIPNILLKTSK